MSAVSVQPPRTIMEVFQMLPEGTLAELIHGKIYMSPSPLREHQRLVLKLGALLNQFVEDGDLGEVFIAPYDVYLDEKANVVQPDILFVRKDNLSIVQGHIHGVPDLVIELLSPGSLTHDLKRKKSLYEKHGVKEYWVIDPVTKDTMGFILKNKKYKELPLSIGKFTSPLLNNTFKY